MLASDALGSRAVSSSCRSQKFVGDDAPQDFELSAFAVSILCELLLKFNNPFGEVKPMVY